MTDAFEKIRREIDETDRELLALLEKRMDCAREAGRFKRENGLPIYDAAREQAMFENYARLTKKPENFDYIRPFMLSLLRASKREQRRGLNVYFIGMPGTGKSRLAKETATLLGKKALDTDSMVEEEACMRIPELFASRGETEFRRLEAEMLLRAASQGYSIVATGGGVLTYPNNLAVMKGSGRVVYLEKSLEELFKQDTTNRPLLAGGKADIERLYYERYSAYLDAADFVVNVDAPDALELLADYCGE